MAKRESLTLYQPTVLENFSVATGASTYYNASTAPYIDYRYSDTATVKRLRPVLPWMFPTPMKKFEWVTIAGSADGHTIDGSTRYTWIGRPFSYYTTPSWNVLPGVSIYGNGVPLITKAVELEWEAASRLLSKIRDSSLALGVTLVEARTTANWIASRVSDIARLITAVKRADWRTFKKTISNVSEEYKKLTPRGAREVSISPSGTIRLIPKFRGDVVPHKPSTTWSSKTAAGRWLEYRYAVSPLLADVDAFAKAFAEFMVEHRLDLIHRWATAVDIPSGGSAIELRCASVRSWGGRLSKTSNFKSVRIVRYSVHYTYDKWMAGFAQTGLDNYALTVWEKIPYSFVFDWLVDFGSYLELCTATVGCEFISGTLSYRLAGRLDFSPVVFTSNLRATKFWNVKEPSSHYSAYERQVIGTFPNFLPTVRNPLSTRHVLDALALIRVTKP